MSGYNPVVTSVGTADDAPVGAGKLNGMHALVLGAKLIPATPAPPASTSGAPESNWDPTGAHTLCSGNNSRVDLNPTGGAAYLSGLDATGATDEKRIKLRNIHAANVVTLGHANANSTATNRFYCPGLVDFDLLPGETVTLEYWTPDNVWVVIP